MYYVPGLEKKREPVPWTVVIFALLAMPIVLPVGIPILGLKYAVGLGKARRRRSLWTGISLILLVLSAALAVAFFSIDAHPWVSLGAGAVAIASIQSAIELVRARLSLVRRERSRPPMWYR